jgi:hypothetical protein
VLARMPARHSSSSSSSSRAPFASLSGAALLRILELLCDSCSPEVPGTCWVSPVCKQWQRLACSVKGLRVVFRAEEEQQVASFCAWLRRHAPRVKALAVTGREVAAVLRVLARRGDSSSGSESDSSSSSSWEEPEADEIEGGAIAAQAAGSQPPGYARDLPWPLTQRTGCFHVSGAALFLRPSSVPAPGCCCCWCVLSTSPVCHAAASPSAAIRGAWHSCRRDTSAVADMNRTGAAGAAAVACSPQRPCCVHKYISVGWLDTLLDCCPCVVCLSHAMQAGRSLPRSCAATCGKHYVPGKH